MNEFHYLDREGRQQGPVPEAEVHRLRQQRVIGHETPLWRPGWTNWQIYSAAFPHGTQPPPLPKTGPRVYPRIAKMTGWLLVLVAVGALLPVAFAAFDRFLFLAASSDHVEQYLFAELLPWGLVSLAGLIVAFAMLVRRKLPPTPGILGLLVNIGALGLLLATIGLNKASQMKEAIIAGHNYDDSIEIAPIDAKGKATNGGREIIQDAWYRRHLLDAWLERTPADAPDYAPHREVIELSVRRRESPLSTDEWDRLNLLFREVVSARKRDPHALLACLDMDLPPQTRADLLTAASALFEQQEGGHALRFLCAKLLAEARTKAGPGQASVSDADDETLAQLSRAIAAGSYEPGEWIVLSTQIASVGGDGLVDRRGADLVKLLDEHPTVPEWLTERWKGAWEIKQAWKARGGGLANTVTEDGWQAFWNHSLRAAKHLERSWQLEPGLPFAAHDMAYVQLGTGGYEDMRLWFDRTIAADFDYGAAYGRMLWGLRPRWHGSHEAMLDFGRVCAATERFDTWVPWRMHEAAYDVIAETKETAALLRQRDVYDELIRVYSGYDKFAANDPEKQQTYRTWKLASAVTGIHWDDALRFLEETGTSLSMEVCRKFGQHPQDLAVAALARGDALAHPSYQALTHLSNRRYAEAVAALEEARKHHDPSQKTVHRWLDILSRQIALEQRFENGDVISITDGDAALDWELFPPDARILDDDSIELSAHTDYQALLSRFDVGERVVIEGTFAVEPPEADFELLFKYGNHYQYQNAWRTVRFRRFQGEPMVGFGRGWLHPTHIDKSGFDAENRFTIVFTPVSGTVVMNEKEIIKAEGLRDNLLRAGRLQFGITFGSSPEQAKITLKNVTLRRP